MRVLYLPRPLSQRRASTLMLQGHSRLCGPKIQLLWDYGWVGPSFYPNASPWSPVGKSLLKEVIFELFRNVGPCGTRAAGQGMGVGVVYSRIVLDPK